MTFKEVATTFTKWCPPKSQKWKICIPTEYKRAKNKRRGMFCNKTTRDGHLDNNFLSCLFSFEEMENQLLQCKNIAQSLDGYHIISD